MTKPIPLAIGMLHIDPNTPVRQRSRARIRLGAFAYREGYALLETFEVAGLPVRDDATHHELMQLVARHSVRVVLAADDVPFRQIERLQGSGLVAVTLVPRGVLMDGAGAPQAGTTSGTAASQTRSKLAR